MKSKPVSSSNSQQQREQLLPKSVKISPWKQAIITVAGVYPLLLSYEWLAKQILPVEVMDRRVTLLIVVIMIASTMVFLLMPLLVKLLGRWLFKK